MTESTFTRWFCKQVEAVGATVLVLGGGNVRQQSGLPDRYVCHWKFRGWLEFKRESRTVKTHQKILMRRLLDRGDVCLVVRLRGDAEVAEIEDPEGHAMGWVNLALLRRLKTDRARGQRLLVELAKARDLCREKGDER